jgi:omega-amidase
MSDLKVTFLQQNPIWEQVDANVSGILRHIENEHTEGVDLFILPEMFTTGFTMNPAPYADESRKKGVALMEEIARHWKCCVCGSIIVEENGIYFNRLYWVTEHGVKGYYDKRHLFTMAGEDRVYERGVQVLLVECKGWKIMPLICYDLRFPVWCRNRYDYDLQLFVANWPERRIQHWDLLLAARAVENQAYVIGVNRVGYDDGGVYHNGASQVILPDGQILHRITEKEQMVTISLEKERLTQTRQKFPFLEERDSFDLYP